MDSMTEPTPLPDLILSLEQATFMAKQLPSTTDPTHLQQIYTSLHHAHRHLSNVLCRVEFPSKPVTPPPAAQNPFSSATGNALEDNGSEPMQVGDDDEAAVEENSRGTNTTEKVEEKMRDCFIKNKRPKRSLSPSTAAVVEERRLADDRCLRDYNPHATRLRGFGPGLPVSWVKKQNQFMGKKKHNSVATHMADKLDVWGNMNSFMAMIGIGGTNFLMKVLPWSQKIWEILAWAQDA